MSSLDDFRSELERELVAAAYRQNEARQPAFSSRFPISRIIGAAAATVVVVVAALGVLVARPNTASAQVFRITTTTDAITLDVIDVVEDPAEVTNQLRDEIGVDSELFAVPVPPTLVGAIVAVASTSDITPRTEFAPNGTVEQVELSRNYDGVLLIEYGRPANNGEFYAATVTDPICAELYGQPPTNIVDAFDGRAINIRYERIDPDGLAQTDVTPGSLPSTSGLVNITYLSADVLVASFDDTPPTTPERTACQ